ncbi:MAG TPA: MerR family transcriptional regulator, partial [Microbacterium sp.]|nr:MerR family transcriptional regulator [Microbacterium sp.]
MAAAGAARERTAPTGLLSIGQVLARLTPEFSQLTSSKLRFLEVQGIVTPSRTESGYRKFSAHDVERLRTALTLQRDHYLPLSVIREQLDEAEAKGQGWADIVPRSITPPARRHRRDEL